VQVLHNGVDAQLFSPQPEIARKPCQIMATASADTPTKGLHILLAAAAKLRASYPGLGLTLIGRPKPGGDTERLVRELGLEAQVRWIKDADHGAIVRLYAESALAVVPSLYEGFGLPAVEAMACGVPLVSSDGGALAEVVGNGGVVVPAGDIEALTRALDSLLGDQGARDELGREARARVEAHFSWDVCAQRLSEYYRQRVLTC
jgi:glycosyltransferase involved in cell wall biosynthesis